MYRHNYLINFFFSDPMGVYPPKPHLAYATDVTYFKTRLFFHLPTSFYAVLMPIYFCLIVSLPSLIPACLLACPSSCLGAYLHTTAGMSVCFDHHPRAIEL